MRRSAERAIARARHLRDRLALRQPDLGLAQLADDLLGLVALAPAQCCPLPRDQRRFSTSSTGLVSGGQVTRVGSVLTGPQAFIDQARVLRRQVGGGMRQAEVIAAAALPALEHHVDRLADDHARASTLARGLAELPSIVLDPSTGRYDIVFFELEPAIDGNELRYDSRPRGSSAAARAGSGVRMVTHLDVDDDAIQHALKASTRVLAAMEVG